MTFCPCTGTPRHYAGYKGDVRKLEEFDSPDFQELRECWNGLRAAVKGQKRVKSVASDLNWLELPEHIEFLLECDDPDQRKKAKISADKYYARTPYDESVKVAKSITLGSIFRIPANREGLDDENESNFGTAQLDLAEISEGSWLGTEKYLASERFTTGWVASYIFNRTGPNDTQIPTVKHYCSENIMGEPVADSEGNLTYILFREEVDATDSDALSEDEPGFRFRELELVDGDFIERIWVSEDEETFEVDAEQDRVVIVRGEALNEIPVVITGRIDDAPFEPLFEKTKELFQVNAQIKYRQQKIGHPIVHINYTDGPNESYVCSGYARGPGSERALDQDLDPLDSEPAVMLPGITFETQKAVVSRLYDTGEGLDHLKEERKKLEGDLERLGGHYGITKTASNVSEAVETMRQGREAAFVINYVESVSQALTKIAQWIAFFWGVTDVKLLNEINISLNTELSDKDSGVLVKDIPHVVFGWQQGLYDQGSALDMLRKSGKITKTLDEILEALEFEGFENSDLVNG